MQIGDNGKNGAKITWVQFISIIVPVLVAIIIGCYTLIVAAETRLQAIIDHQSRIIYSKDAKIDKLLDDINTIKSDVATIKAKFEIYERRGWQIQ